MQQNHPCLAYLTCNREFPPLLDGQNGITCVEDSTQPVQLILDHFELRMTNAGSVNYLESWNERFPNLHYDGVASVQRGLKITSEFDFLGLHLFACALNARIFVVWRLLGETREECSLYSIILGPLRNTDFDIVLAARKVPDEEALRFAVVSQEKKTNYVMNAKEDSFFAGDACLRILELPDGKYVPYYAPSKDCHNEEEFEIKVCVNPCAQRFPSLEVESESEDKPLVVCLRVPVGACANLVDSFTQAFEGVSISGKVAARETEHMLFSLEGYDKDFYLVSEGFGTHYVLIKRGESFTSAVSNWTWEDCEPEDLAPLKYEDVTQSKAGKNAMPVSYSEIADSEYLKWMCALNACQRVGRTYRFVDKREAGKTETVTATAFFLPWIEPDMDSCYQWIPMSNDEQRNWEQQELEKFGKLIHEREQYLFEKQENMKAILLPRGNVGVNLMLMQMNEKCLKIQEKLNNLRDATSPFIVYVADREYRGPSHIIQLVADINDPGNGWTFSVSPDEMDDVKSVSEILARIPRNDKLSAATLMAKENAPACFPVLLRHMKSILKAKPTKYPEIPRELKRDAEFPNRSPKVESRKCSLKAYELHEVLGHGYITSTAHSVVYTSQTIKYAFVQKDIAVFVCTSADSKRFSIYHLTDSSCVLDSRRPDAEVPGQFIGATFNKFHKMIIVAYKEDDQEYLHTFHLGNSQMDEYIQECNTVARLGHVSLNYMAVGGPENESIFGVNENGSIVELPCENWMLEKLPHLKRFLRVSSNRCVYWDDEGVWEIARQTIDSKDTLAVSPCEDADDQAEREDSANSSTRDRDSCSPQIQPRMLKLAAKKAATNPLLKKHDTRKNVEAVLLLCFPVLVTTDGCLVQYYDKHFVLFRPDVSERLLDLRLRQFYQMCLSSVCLFAIEKFLCETQCSQVQLLTVIDIHGRSALHIDRLLRTSFASISVKGVSVALTKVQYQTVESLLLVVYFNEDSNAALEAASADTISPVILCAETRNRAKKQMERQGKAKLVHLHPMAPENLRDHNELTGILSDKKYQPMKWKELLNYVKRMIARYLTHKMFTTVPLGTISKFCGI